MSEPSGSTGKWRRHADPKVDLSTTYARTPGRIRAPKIPSSLSHSFLGGRALLVLIMVAK
jgi:hypothetical protein